MPKEELRRGWKVVRVFGAGHMVSAYCTGIAAARYEFGARTERQTAWGPLAVFTDKEAAEQFANPPLRGHVSVLKMYPCVYKVSRERMLWDGFAYQGPEHLPEYTDFADWVEIYEGEGE